MRGAEGDLHTHYPQGRSSDGTQSEEIESSVSRREVGGGELNDAGAEGEP